MIEEWKDIKGYEGLYKISNTGKVLSCNRYVKGVFGCNKIHKGGLLKERITLGYNQVILHKNGKGKQFKVHRMVLEHFVGPCPIGYVCNHKDGNRSNNNVDNLEWCTQGYNNYHALYITKNHPISISQPKGKDSKNSKKVLQKNLNGDTIKLRYCISDVERELGYDQGNISTACKKGLTRYGYKWELV